ncbi:hypothetical protein EYF80_027772 [Liparis tanakae]|uniref:Uncharacterized protein n=1 Tax=Liparis tanakae TaxID=230148 RepID=A0A4Z2HAW9_9TELE|nr:hypothetical protein EYF80_027772 [Liparis tanakae]
MWPLVLLTLPQQYCPCSALLVVRVESPLKDFHTAPLCRGGPLSSGLDKAMHFGKCPKSEADEREKRYPTGGGDKFCIRDSKHRSNGLSPPITPQVQQYLPEVAPELHPDEGVEDGIEAAVKVGYAPGDGQHLEFDLLYLTSPLLEKRQGVGQQRHVVGEVAQDENHHDRHNHADGLVPLAALGSQQDEAAVEQSARAGTEGASGPHDGNVAVATDARQQQHAAVEVDTVGGPQHLASHGAHEPTVLLIVDDERQGDHEDQVRHGDIEEVDVCHRLGPLVEYVGGDHQSVAEQAEGTDDGVDVGLCDDFCAAGVQVAEPFVFKVYQWGRVGFRPVQRAGQLFFLPGVRAVRTKSRVQRLNVTSLCSSFCMDIPSFCCFDLQKLPASSATSSQS